MFGKGAALHPVLGLGDAECRPAVDLLQARDLVADGTGGFGAVAAGGLRRLRRSP